MCHSNIHCRSTRPSIVKPYLTFAFVHLHEHVRVLLLVPYSYNVNVQRWATRTIWSMVQLYRSAYE